MNTYAVRIGSFINNPGNYGEKVVWWAAEAAPTKEAFGWAGFIFYKEDEIYQKDIEDDELIDFTTHGFVKKPMSSTWTNDPYYWSVHNAENMSFIGHYVDVAEKLNLLHLSGKTAEELIEIKSRH